MPQAIPNSSDICQQSEKEWLDRLETRVPFAEEPQDAAYKDWIHEAPKRNSVLTQPVVELIYSHHRTAKSYGKGTVILVFIRHDTGEEVVTFYNADTTIQRGKNRGKHYPIGKKGQFLPPEGGNFRKFWMAVFKCQPTRWSLAYKQLRSKMKGRIFTGDITTEFRKPGEQYFKVTNLKEVTK